MNIKQAREYFDLGVIRGFEAVLNPVMGEKGWFLVINGKEMGRTWTLETATGKQRLFSSVEAIVTVVENIKGGEVRVIAFQ